MATFYVDNTNESGPGSLREAILDANAASGADEIRFNVLTGTILVDGDDLDISDDLRIIGPVDASGRPTITIDGEADSRIFDIGSSAPVTLENLVITNGESTDDGGAIDSASDLTLINTVVSNSLTSTSNEEGGGIYVDGNLRLLDSWIVGNRTTGFQNSEGGGVFVDGNLYAANSTISGNFTDSRDSEGGGIYASGDVIGTNLTIHGNVASNPDSRGSFLWTIAGIRGMELTDNVYDAPNLDVGGYGTFAVQHSASDLGEFTLIDGNTWPMPTAGGWAEGGMMSVGTTGRQGDIQDPAEWHGFDEVGQDAFADVDGDQAYRLVLQRLGLAA